MRNPFHSSTKFLCTNSWYVEIIRIFFWEVLEVYLIPNWRLRGIRKVGCVSFVKEGQLATCIQSLLVVFADKQYWDYLFGFLERFYQLAAYSFIFLSFNCGDFVLESRGLHEA